MLHALITLPVSFFSGYCLEHRYNLSNQSVLQWVRERLKGIIVSLPLGVLLLLALYYCLRVYGTWWWLPMGCAIAILSVCFARLAPLLIFPLFYTFTPISQGSLKERIAHLCTQAGLRVEGVFTFNLSKDTKKANAGFAGIGKAKRVILGDTLVREFSEEEIETVFAHEVGHYVHRHIPVSIFVGVVSLFAILFLTSRLYEWSLEALGYSSLSELGALPLLGIWLSVLGAVIAPIGNAISRKHEREADAYAVERTGKRDAFVSALNRLAAMNISDIEPHPLVEWLFYSHPSISKRIRAIESMAPR
jgi:STE24 endopeptidase